MKKKFRVSRAGEFVGFYTAESATEAKEAAMRYAFEEFGSVEPPEFEATEVEEAA